jgi:bifunctional non-homologous end joining protein LigD
MTDNTSSTEDQLVTPSPIEQGLSVIECEFQASFDMLALRQYAINRKHGFYDKPADDGTRIALMHSELSEALDGLRMPNYAKTSGSRGIHVYVPIIRGPTQKQVWHFAKDFAIGLASVRPDLITAEYRVAKRQARRVLVDYNQNAWGRTLASVYSVRPKPRAPVSTPVTWKEIENGIETEDFRLDNVPARIQRLGDLWKPLLESRGRVRLKGFLEPE